MTNGAPIPGDDMVESGGNISNLQAKRNHRSQDFYSGYVEAHWAQRICPGVVAGLKSEPDGLKSHTSGLSPPCLVRAESREDSDARRAGCYEIRKGSAGLYLHL